MDDGEEVRARKGFQVGFKFFQTGENHEIYEIRERKTDRKEDGAAKLNAETRRPRRKENAERIERVKEEPRNTRKRKRKI
jgi:hypothetical protein